MRFVVGLVVGAVASAAVILLGGVGVTDCAAVRESFGSYEHDPSSEDSLEELGRVVALARDHPECFAPSELDDLPRVPEASG